MEVTFYAERCRATHLERGQSLRYLAGPKERVIAL